MTTCREQGKSIAVAVSKQQVCLCWSRRAPIVSSLLKLCVPQSYPWKEKHFTDLSGEILETAMAQRKVKASLAAENGPNKAT